MARGVDYPANFVASAIKAGLSATKALNVYRDGGGRVRTQTWYRLYGEASAALGDRLDAAARPLNRKARGDERMPWTTVTARGVADQVEVFVRDRESGLVSTRQYTAFTRQGLTRQEAVEEAIDAYLAGEEEYGEEVLGGVHVASFAATPGAA